LRIRIWAIPTAPAADILADRRRRRRRAYWYSQVRGDRGRRAVPAILVRPTVAITLAVGVAHRKGLDTRS
jgi:hypothetical protein